MNTFARIFGLTAVNRVIHSSQHGRQMYESVVLQSRGPKNIKNRNSVPINIFKETLLKRNYSTRLHGKFAKAYKKLAIAHGKYIIGLNWSNKYSDLAVQKKNELSKLESKWLVQANRYANNKQYDKEYQVLYMMICYFAHKKNSLTDKVQKANLDNNHKHVLTLLSHLRPEEIPPNLYDEYAQALIHSGQSEKAFNFVTTMLDNPQMETEDPSWRERLYFTKVQMQLERGLVKEAIDTCESHMDHDNHLWPLAMGTILMTAEEFQDGGTDALQCYDTAIEELNAVPISVYRARPHLLKGKLFENTGDVRAAIKEYEYALWIKPHEKSAMERLIGLYSEIGQSDDAQKMQQKLAIDLEAKTKNLK